MNGSCLKGTKLSNTYAASIKQLKWFKLASFFIDHANPTLVLCHFGFLSANLANFNTISRYSQRV